MNTYRNNNDQGVVYKKNLNNYQVNAADRTVSCAMASHLVKTREQQPRQKSGKNHPSKIQVSETGESVVVGDWVRFVETAPGSGRIVEILPRRNQLSRRSPVPMPTAHAGEQVIAANVDQIIPVFAAAQPTPKWNMLDRYLVAAETAGIPALICITKLDLVDDDKSVEELDAVVEDYRRIGYPVVLVSSRTGKGIAEIQQALQGRISIFLGKSGVGKTSLLNAVQPGLGQRVSAVNQVTGKGKHTTTHQEMFALETGGAIVDTPGVREFGLWDVAADDLAPAFREMRPYVGRCKFGLDCSHDEEPGCAIRKAVLAGSIGPRRYQSFLHLKEEIYHESLL